MKCMILFGEPSETFAERNDPAKAGPYWGAWTAYVDALARSGIVVNGHGLEAPSTATVVRVRDGRRHVQDGPFADTKEQLGGYFVVEVASIDEAVEWAARSPAASYGSVEVRPVMPPPPGTPGGIG